jgi:glutamate/tyrosine decarboxylase-like PLP-dependent enzyme
MKPEPDEKTLFRAAEIAVDYLRRMPDMPVREDASLDEMRAAIRVPLNDAPIDAGQVIEELAAAVEPGLVQIQSPRYFGFVIGGGLDAAMAADWLATVWDQNAGGYPCGPSVAVVEEAVCEWVLDVLGLPAHSGVGLTTGCQMAHFTCLAAARWRKLADTGWDVEADGLFGAPPLRVIAGDHAHTTVFAAVRMLGLGRNRVELVETDSQGRMHPGRLQQVLRSGQGPAIVIGQVGEVNTGAIDPLEDIAAAAFEYGAWLHLDGAFGLWAAASPALRSHVAGSEDADSWATDAHKWLNVPYDSGLAFVAHPDAHRAAVAVTASYLMHTDDGAARDQIDWTPEFSRRARGFPVYAALRSLGRTGVAELVDRCCAHARRFAERLASAPGVEILNDVVLNQVLVRFGADDGRTAAVIDRIQREGVLWASGTTWHGLGAMRISVSNWSTTAEDVDRSVDAILAALAVTEPALVE